MANNYQNTYKCNICLKTSYQPINLKCNHHPCYNCIQPYVKIDQTSKIEKKYYILCPNCTKKTVFYDVRHLIMTKSQFDDEETFVTNKFINKPEAKITNKLENNYLQVESQQSTRRGSIQSIANVSVNKVYSEIRCNQHKQTYKYFCFDCHEHQDRNDFILCHICAKSHYKEGHRLIALKQAETKILDYNLMKKQQICQKYDEINVFAQNSSKARQSTLQHFKQLQDLLTQQFKSIFEKLNNKYHEMKQQIKESYQASLRVIDKNIDEIVSSKQRLSDLRAMELKDIESSLKFYQNCSNFNLESIDRLQINVKQLTFVNKKIPHFQRLFEEINCLQFDNSRPVKNSDHKRKYSQQEGLITNRSCSQKQNKKIIEPPESKVLFKKLFA